MSEIEKDPSYQLGYAKSLLWGAAQIIDGERTISVDAWLKAYEEFAALTESGESQSND